ncbi:MAG: hypothetical protein WBF71_14935, partial [Microthrixaceae bacterium]
GLMDETAYLDGSTDDRIQRYLDDKSMAQPMQDFIDRGVRAADIAAMSLPASYTGRAALDLCERTIHELRTLWP